MEDSEYGSESDGPDDNSLCSSQFTRRPFPPFIRMSGSLFDEIYIPEQPTSPSQVDVSDAPTRVLMIVGDEVREITHSGASSRPAVSSEQT